MVAVAATALVGAAVAGGVALTGDDDPSQTPSRVAANRPCARPYVELLPTERTGKGSVRLERIARVFEPTALAFEPGPSGRGILGSRTGELRAVAAGALVPGVVLDLSDGTVESGDGGLLGLAYDPDDPWLYVYRTTQEQDEELLAFPLDADGLPDAEGQRVLLAVDHPPSEQHHGGGLGFGPDGYLYLGLGDGGGLGDPRENGQDLGELLGKVLRIDPTPEAEAPYAVPADNPFVGRDGARPEIWALGLRNPFRLSFDPATGDLWVGDVGQSCWEELNRLPAGQGGQNLGWDVREGTERFEGGRLTGGESLEPELAHPHRRGWCALVLGPVTDDGLVLHADYCRGRIMEFRQGGVDEPPRLYDTGIRVEHPTALVADPAGDVWVLSLDGEVYRLVG